MDSTREIFSLPLAEKALVFSLQSGKEFFPVCLLDKDRWQLPVTAPLPDIFPDQRAEFILLQIIHHRPVRRREE